MTLEEFITKYTGKFVEYHSYGSGALNQCTDCTNQYIVEVLGKTAIIGTNAVDFPTKASKDEFDFIKDAPLIVPEKGDLVVWKTNHIAICLYADVELPWFTSFDQNWPTGSVCKKVDHSYSNVFGWLRPKGGSMSCLLYNNNEDEKLFSELVSKASKYDEFKKEGYENIGQVKFFMDELRQNVLEAKQAKRIEKERGDELRKELNEFIATLANENHLHTVQEKTEILAEAKKAGANAKDLEDLQRAFGAFKEEASKTESDLKVEIAKLRALLKNENVLANSSLVELIREVIKRLVQILPKGK